MVDGGPDGAAFIKNQPEKIAYGMRHMGYRLRPMRISYPKTIRSGKPFELQMEWVNQGVGRAMCDFHLHVLLTDAAGRVMARGDTGPLPTSRWIKAPAYDGRSVWRVGPVPTGNGPIYSIMRRLILSVPRSGNFLLSMAMIDPRTGAPVRLPLKSGHKHGYVIGPVTLRG